ncbi:hypothetical protein LUZ61_014273 [Rhynchospora tenuis]|uniref:Legume lectin domain-containing protein n=1 Tax=Rhynchospora tenuis TaxID=198213 RepID=A0AAD5WB41_9POAL|nr:hypothetical protein LUZ61_014273 [Rhynchospora tenuis]
MASPGNSLSFNMDFTKHDYSSNLNCTLDALNYGNRCQDLASLGLTKNMPGGGIDSSVGKAFYRQPVLLWDNTTGEVTSFNTAFSFQIQMTQETKVLADGLAFFLSAYPPPDSTDGCRALGLFNLSSISISSPSHPIYCNSASVTVDKMSKQATTQMVAVEFDTYRNWWDPQQSGCHIGIDINNITSTVYEIVPNSSFIGKNMTAQISYNNLTQILNLLLSQDDDPTINFGISTRVNLASILPTEIAIGFSAATGWGTGSFEVHLLYSWSFNSTLVPRNNIKSTLSGWVQRFKYRS